MGADTIPEKFNGSLLESEDDRYFVIEDVTEDGIRVGELGNRSLDECPVGEGDECVDPRCNGRVGETERDPETHTAHELYCYECGLNWVEHGSVWEEQYVEWPTSFSYSED